MKRVHTDPTPRRWPPGGAVLLLLGLLAAVLGLLAAFADAPIDTPVRIVAGALGLGALATALWTLRRQWQLFDALIVGLRALGHGRSETRLPEDLPGAFGELARAANRLGAQLATLSAGLEQRVEEHTRRLREERDALAQANQHLRTAANQAQDEARAQSELLSSLSHELRTPLTGILGYADLLRRSGLDAEQSQQLDMLEKSARSLLTMINDLLDWSRIEAGRLRLNEETLDVIDLVEDTCTLLAPLAYDKDLELVRIVYHDVPRQVRGDAQRLRQILTNLLSNAIKFTETGEVVVRVMREREDAGRTWLRFSVTDTGIGISEEQQARLFQPFRQVGRSAQGGSGLGLSITRKLTELMGGEISLQSTPGKGSTFSVLLPCKLIAEAESSPSYDRRLADRSVWLFEAHATARLALVHWLQFWGMQVRSFTDAEALAEALRTAAPSAKPDLVILGLKPGDRGLPPFRATLAACAEHQPPLLALVASAALSVHESLRDAGAAACHPKSIGRQRLHDEILRLTTAPDAVPAPETPARCALVADNNVTNRRYISALCRRLGIETLEAGDGRTALELWRRARPQIVLLDAHMPGVDGPGCARQIRAEETGDNRCRILAISAHLEPEERAEFLRAGADAILIKPFDEQTLRRHLDPPRGSVQPATARLAADPELLALLREELPQQLRELERAFDHRDLAAAREAAHTLRGTAAFYHLASLRQTASALEEWLRRTSSLPVGAPNRRELDNVRRAVDETLAAIQKP
ncbi:two-component system, NarL family, sensor histidine kinase BarA [Fontimonas thermophila]|uniref:histidine kinase n=1 Tax=Fontimonas thermophila TaxID=1076937 RepID=A0A1I2K6D0_9GAMM|nr:hybrid sensor histidine kinase/response regulator [Fontimonas thermophila]SFF61899.1 two-component system, NarL family, sensor histidine kinase BarA [Fontimonas thermophila]